MKQCKAKHWLSLLLTVCVLLSASCAFAQTSVQVQPFTVFRRLVVGCQGEDVYQVTSKLYELGYLPKPPAVEPSDEIYTAAVAKAVTAYETQYYIDPATVVPPTSPNPVLRGSSMEIERVDGELTQAEQWALLRVEANLDALDGLKVTVKNAQATLTWTASKRVLGYEVYRDGVLLETVTTNRYVDETPVQGVDHTYEVRPFSYSENRSGATISCFVDYYYEKISYKDLMHHEQVYKGKYVQLSSMVIDSFGEGVDKRSSRAIAVLSKMPYVLDFPDFQMQGWIYDRNNAAVTLLIPNERVSIKGQYMGVTTITYQGKSVLAPVITVMELTLY